MESLAGEALRRRKKSGPAPKVNDNDVQNLMEEGLSFGQMSEWFRHHQGVSISRQALGKRVAELRGAVRDQGEFVLPWAIKASHADGSYLYSAVLAYGKWKRGDSVSPKQLRLARELEERLHDMHVVMLYRPDKGFVLRSRQPSDGPSVLAVA